MEKDPAIFFLNQLRQARAMVLRYSEAADSIIHVLERMDMYLAGEMKFLGEYEGHIKGVAGVSLLARKVPKEVRELHIPFIELFRSVREARNTAMHEGAYARHLATHAVKLALVLENALMNGLDLVRDLMVPNPVCAEMWQPLSFIRQTMLENSFSHLPVNMSAEGPCDWRLISDKSLAKYLRAAGSAEETKERLVRSLINAEAVGGIQLCQTKQCHPEEPVSSVLAGWDGPPILVVRGDSVDLVGILTAFDLL